MLPKPVFNGSGMSLVFFRDKKPDKFCVAHPRLIVDVDIGTRRQLVTMRRRTSGHGSREYAINHL